MAIQSNMALSQTQSHQSSISGVSFKAPLLSQDGNGGDIMNARMDTSGDSNIADSLLKSYFVTIFFTFK